MKNILTMTIVLAFAASVFADFDISGIPMPNSIKFLTFKLILDPQYSVEVWQKNQYILHDFVSVHTNQIIDPSGVTNITVEGEVTNFFYTPLTNTVVVASTNDIVAYEYPPVPVVLGTLETTAMSTMSLQQFGLSQTNTVKDVFNALLKAGCAVKEIQVNGGGI